MTRKTKIAVTTLSIASVLAIGAGTVACCWDSSSSANSNYPTYTDSTTYDTDNENFNSLVITDNIQQSSSLSIKSCVKVADTKNSDSDLSDTYIITAKQDGHETLNWKLFWAGENDWSNDKDVADYVELEELENDQVQLTLVEKFGDQIKLNVITSMTSKSASCTVDCAQKIEYASQTLHLSEYNYDTSFNYVEFGGGIDSLDNFYKEREGINESLEYFGCNLNGSSFEVEYTEGTLRSRAKWKLNIYLSDYVLDYIEENVGPLDRVLSSNYGSDFTVYNGSYFSSEYINPFDKYYGLPYYFFNREYVTDAVIYDMLVSLNAADVQPYFFEIHSTLYNDYSSDTVVYRATMSSKYFAKSTSISIDNSEIIF